MAISVLPLPEVRDPSVAGLVDGADNSAEVQTADTAEATPPTGDGSEPAADGIAAANTASALWEEAPRITDERTLATLQTELQNSARRSG